YGGRTVILITGIVLRPDDETEFNLIDQFRRGWSSVIGSNDSWLRNIEDGTIWSYDGNTCVPSKVYILGRVAKTLRWLLAFYLPQLALMHFYLNLPDFR
ncbi:MAG: hypothetical protein ACHP7O_07775, partial [Burkholderiales bacterium]